ncbi:MAG: PAS domain-containing protein [Rhodospirillaceae bacterium]|nr:PAS domain-containing protein [Rhodospirillaceae bacterium]
MSLAFLALDLFLPLGIAGGVFYIVVILLGLWFPSRNQVAVITLIAALLIILGYFLSPEGGEHWKVLFNRGLALLAIFATGGVIYFTKNLVGIVSGFSKRHELALFIIACVMSLAFLSLDLFLPLGVAGGVFYVAVILLGLWFPSRNQVAAITLIVALLVILGYFLSPEGGEYWKVLFNRGLALLAILATGGVIYFSKKQAEDTFVATKQQQNGEATDVSFSGSGAISNLGYRGLALAFPVLTLITVLNIWLSHAQEEAEGRVTHTLEVRIILSNTLSAMQDAETGQRGFLLTGDDDYLEPHINSFSRVNQMMENLRELTSDNVVQQQLLERLAPLIDEKHDELEQTILLWRKEGPKAALNLVTTHRGKNIMDRLRGIVAEMEAEESRLLNQREDLFHRGEVLGRAINIIGFILLVLIGTILVFRMRALIGLHDESEALLRKAKNETELANVELFELTQTLESRVKGRTNELAESERNLARAQELAHLGSWGWDIESGNESWSQEQYRIFGLNPDSNEASYDLFLGALHPDDKDDVVLAINAALDGTRPYDCEFRIVRPSGEIRNIQAYGEVIRDADDRPISMFGTILDITETKNMHEQLIQSSKMATLGEMATGVAHELNQPLNVIRMAISNVQEHNDSGSIESEYLSGKLDKVVRQVERAASIIDHMRIFGRKPDKEMVTLDVEKMVYGSLGLIGEQLRLADIEMTTDIMEPGGTFLGYQVQVEQVLLNLLTNARDALEAKDGDEKRITLRTLVDRSGSNVIIEVEDTGGGIAPELLPRIFEPFYTTKEVGQGTGLGLSISYGIVRDMGGTLKAHNTETGACFTITLPVAEGK